MLDRFDVITIILNYSYGPISSFTEIYLLEQFNQTYLEDSKETFYNNVDIDYRYNAESGTVLFAEGSATITSESTSFESIDYCRNPDISNNDKLTSYGLEIFDDFEIYQEESSIIYVADSDMNGEPDYKFTLDVDGDGEIDIIKYGVDDPQGSGEIYWHTIIQDFQSTEINVKQELLEVKKTKWFDINDQQFAYYDFDVLKLIEIVLTLPLLLYHISKMILPDVDYWAQKSTQQQVNQEEYIKSSFYSIKVDDNRDGIPDSQINYENTKIDTYYEVNEYKKTIIAAKYQDALTYLAELSISVLFGGTEEDGVFNEYLTEEHLNSNDFSSLNAYTQSNAGVLSATYRKFTENITTTYVDDFEQSTITIIDFDDEGDIEEQRVYKDDFENYEIDNVENFFSDLSAEHSITNLDTDQQYTVTFDSEIPFSHPANISWYTTTWGPDQVPTKYDSLQIIGEDYSHTSNYFDKTIIIRIPNRYSIYDDFGSSYTTNGGWVEFEVKGVLITPPDGQVYYTSDLDSFIEGTAKTSGHYFYVDSSMNGFYETVYILEQSYTSARSGIPKYNVISILYNYDGSHDIAPYERIEKQVHTITDFDNLARESTMFGTDWVYNFNNLKNNPLLFEQEKSIWEQYKPKDHIFEIHKLVEKSSENEEFSELFYEIRHETYSEAWKQYRTQLEGDIAQQVFMTLTATGLSLAAEALVTAATAGIGYLVGAAAVAKTLTYLTVYTIMTKFFVDIQLHEAESRTRAETFYPASNEIKGPTNLNEKMTMDRFLQDTMAAALIAHPGGYYTTVSGGEPGDQYTDQLLVSPPNIARSIDSFGGMYELLWENFWSMGETDPDSFTALDFDDINLNYFLLASELPSYNYIPSYSYPNTDSLFNDYNSYALNTLGYLEGKVRIASNNKFNAIRPTIIDGRPQYEFINREDYKKVLPQSGLYQQIVLSEARYNNISPLLGHLVVDVRCMTYSNTQGVNAYDMDAIEIKAGCKAKVPINDNGFEYPIDFISIDVVSGAGYYTQDLIINESYYTVDLGNLYFSKSLEEIISEKNPGFEEALNSGLPESLIYYRVHIYFDVFVPDTTEETHRLALTQATQHAVMDYFNQYTYAEVTANMISEIAYTETMTFWSTMISSAAIYAGSWIVGGVTLDAIAKAGVVLVKSAISEVFDEIIKDAFIEALVENIFDMWGWSENAAMWVSAFATSAREVGGALGQLALSRKGPILKNDIALLQDAINTGDANAIAEISQRIDEAKQQQQEQQQQKQEERSSWTKLFRSGFFKGMFMVMPSILFGSFSFLTVKGLSMIGKGTIDLAPKKFDALKTKINAFKKGMIGQLTGDKSHVLFKGLKALLKKPSGLDSAKKDVNNAFTGRQESDNLAPLLVDVVDIQARKDLAKKFNAIQLSSWISEMVTQDERIAEIKDSLRKTASSIEKVEFIQVIDSIKEQVRKSFTSSPTLLRYTGATGIVLYDPKHIAYGFRPGPNAHRNVKADLSLREDFAESLTTEEYAQELERMYDIDISLQPYLLKDGELTLIPRNGESHSLWLEARNHDINTDKIVLIPMDSVTTTAHIEGILQRIEQNGVTAITTEEVSSVVANWVRSEDQLYTDQEVDAAPSNPYVSHYLVFRELMKDILLRHNVIARNTITALRSVAGNNVMELLTNLRKDSYRYKSRPDYSDLSMIYGQIKAEIVTRFDKRTQSEIMNEIDFLFDLQYKIYGIPFTEFENRFYKHASHTFYSWIGVIQRYDKQNFPRISISALSILIGLSDGMLGATLFKLASGEVKRNELATINKYIDGICSNIGLSEVETNLLRNDLEVVSQPYREMLRAAENAEDTIEVKLDNLRQRYPINRKLDLIESIVSLIGIPNIDKRQISLLLFGNEDYLFYRFLVGGDIDTPPIERRPERTTLNLMKHCVSKFDFTLFFGEVSQSITINEASKLSRAIDILNSKKDGIINLIDRWAKSNPMTTTVRDSYLSSSTYLIKRIYGSDIDDLTYDLLNDIWDTFSIYLDKPKLAFSDIDTALGTAQSHTPISQAFRANLMIGAGKLEAIVTLLEGVLNPASIKFWSFSSSERNKFSNTKLAINVYLDILAEKRSVTNKILRPTQESLKSLFERDQHLRSYLFINLISRDHGFDPLFFDSVDESSILASAYALHHIDSTRSWSVFIRDLLLTSGSYHGVYTSSQVSTQDTKVLSEGMHKLMELGKSRYQNGVHVADIITEADIINVFTNLGGGSLYILNDGRTVLEWWKSGSMGPGRVHSTRSFGDRLYEFNKRIAYVEDNNQNFEMLVNYLYPTLGPTWIVKGQSQIETYLFMKNHPYARKQVHYYVHLEDIDFIRNTWGVWLPTTP